MYQGKFTAKNNADRVDVVAERAAAAEAAAARKLARQNGKGMAAGSAAPAAAVNAAPVKPVKAAPAPEVYEEPKKKGPRTGTVIFYTLYFLGIFLFFAGMYLGLRWLNGWLADYEAAQPTTKCQEVFDELFGDPDWAALYRMAGVEDTEYEGVDQFVAYMEKKTEGKELTFQETSAGLIKGKKYLVKLDNEKIASFMLRGDTDHPTDIPDWELGEVELYFERTESYKIQKVDGHLSYVNGVELDDSFTIQTASTMAEKYLPTGTAGGRTAVQSISGLMGMPEVVITTASGEPVEVAYDEATRTFVEQTIANTMGEAEEKIALETIKAYAEFMINASGSGAKVRKYFDTSSSVYSDITKMAGELWMNKDNGHRFLEESVTDYCRYSDDLFSVHAYVRMNVTNKDGTTKNFDVDQSLFFRMKNGNWVCYEMTNEDVSQPVGKVRLTFMNGDVALYTDFFQTDAASLKTPVLSAPEGKVFSGWVRRDKAENGTTTLTLMFVPDEDGMVTLSSGSNLEPMTLYALFENAENGGTN